MKNYNLAAYILVTVLLLCFAVMNISCGGNEGKAVQKKASLTIIDDLNVSVAFDSVPHRIISLAPNLTEMIYTLGAEKYLIGNTLYCNYPPEARKIAKVGDMVTFDYERILALKPDLIFITVEGNSLESYKKLKNLGLKVFVSNPRSFSGIKKTFMDMGRIFNDSLKSREMVNSWNDKFNSIASKAQKLPHDKGMFIVALNPLMIAGKNTFINELITSAGLDNLAEDSPLNYPIFSREEILKRNPDCIVTTDNSPDIIKKFLDSYPEWKNLNAIKNRKVIMGDPDLYLRPGPRFVSALEDLFNKLHSRGS